MTLDALAIASAKAARLSAERAALRRVALVAREASPAEVFTVIAEELGRLLDTEDVRVWRYEHGPSAVVVGGSGVGTRVPVADESPLARVFETGHAVGADDVMAAPIAVKGRLWGAVVAETPRASAAAAGLADVITLMEPVIADTESAARGERLVNAQAALRQVATLVAKEAPPDEIFATLAQEVGHVLGEVDCALFRAEADATATSVAVSGAEMSSTFPVGTRFPVDGDPAVASVLRTGRPCRIDDETGHRMRSAVACPIVVGDRVWGVLCVASFRDEPLPRGSQARLAQFGDLAATAIANAGARAQVKRLASEQAALRRVATLVAEGAEPGEVFEAVAVEMEALLDADGVTVSRYEPGGEVTVVANSGPDAWKVPAGTRWNHDGENVTSIVRRTESPARVERYESAHDAIAQLVETLGVRAGVGAPIVVDGGLWGVVLATWTNDEPPPGTEERMSQFAELLETAVANADSRDQLTASRVRLLAAGDEARRRVVRDLHDGAQQRLVHAIITLKLLQRSLREGDGRAASLAEEALEHAQRGQEELRELAHGILPSVLTRGGLRAGVDTLVERIDLPVAVHLPVDRFPAEIEASAYFIVAEALTNAVKHAQAARAAVTGSVEGGRLRLEVRDDGLGGADGDGHGLVGMSDRVTALGGHLEIESPVGGGTRIVATLPLTITRAHAPA